jgi:hypothetical protein
MNAIPGMVLLLGIFVPLGEADVVPTNLHEVKLKQCRGDFLRNLEGLGVPISSPMTIVVAQDGPNVFYLFSPSMLNYEQYVKLIRTSGGPSDFSGVWFTADPPENGPVFRLMAWERSYGLELDISLMRLEGTASDQECTISPDLNVRIELSQ